jgi:hypothetical protein
VVIKNVKIKDILPTTAYHSIGYVNSLDRLNHIYEISTYNAKVFTNIKYINHIINVDEDKYVDLVKSYYKNNVYLFKNFGYQLGFLKQCRDSYVLGQHLQVERIIHATSDILFDKNFLELDIDPDIDFYYLPSVTSITLNHIRHDPNKYIEYKTRGTQNNSLAPQGWFYIIKTNNLNFLNENWEKKAKNQEGALSEVEILQNVKHTKIKSLIEESYFDNYCKFVLMLGMGDASAKQIYFKDLGICHFHFHYSWGYTFK